MYVAALTAALASVAWSTGGAVRVPLTACIVLAGLAASLSLWAIPKAANAFVAKGRFGIDLNKPTTARNKNGTIKRPVKGVKVPEPMGVVPAAMCVLCITLFLPFAFDPEQKDGGHFLQLVAALLSITCATFVGFADDVFDVQGRYRLALSFASTLPLLLVYQVHIGRTAVVLPWPLQSWFDTATVDLGLIYYAILAFQSVFATMAINVYAGVNGLESGQSVILGLSIVVFNLVNLNRLPEDWDEFRGNQLFSLYIALPFTAVCCTLWYHNWFPSAVFCGDTFCYFAGMTVSACAILGHFSKTLWLFLLPQLLNFAYMLPQYPGPLPCPRHRMPAFDPTTGFVQASTVDFHPAELSALGRAAFGLYRALRLVGVEELGGGVVRMSNLTLINLCLHWFGPCREDTLCRRLIGFQIMCSGMAFPVRFYLATFFYEELN